VAEGVGFEPTVPCDTTVFELDWALRTASWLIPDSAIYQGIYGVTFAARLTESSLPGVSGIGLR